MSKKLNLMIVFFLFSVLAFSQAKMEVKNNSGRYMVLKIMKGYISGSLYKTIYVNAYSSKTVYFSSTDYYYTKSKATLRGKNPVYEKGESFRVVNENTGYSVITLEFSITESNVPQLVGGKRISKSEFEMD